MNWKASSEIALMYSHATGLTHLFMDVMPEQSGARQLFLDYVRSVYAGKQNPAELLKLLGGGEQAAQANYRKLMTITEKQLEMLAGNADQVRQLVLCRSQLENWETLSKFTQLKWLDLSFSNISREKLAAIQQISGLQRLSLEATKLDSEVMPMLAKLKKLNDLDVSLCAVDDSGIEALVSHPSLETLWLTGTKVTEKSFPTLSTMPKLSSCDVSSTVITNEAWDSFIAKHPRLKKK